MRQAWSRLKDPWKSQLAFMVRTEGAQRTAKRIGSSEFTVQNLVDGGVVRESVLKRILASLAAVTPPAASAQAAAPPLSCHG